MGKGAVLSGFLHLAVLLLTVFGLPWLYDTNEVLQATPISVISEAQFAELKAQKPPAQKKEEPPKEQEIPPAPPAPDVAQPEPEPEEPAPPEPAPPEPVAQPEPPPEPPQQAQQPPVVQPEPPQEQVVAPEPLPEPEPQPVPPPEPQVAEAQPKPVPPKKPEPPKKKEPAKKKKEKEKPKQEEVAADDTSFLKDIEKKLKKNKKKSQPTETQQAALPPDNYDGPPLSEGEKDMIREQVRANWITDGGMQGLEDMLVVLDVRMNPDGSVVSAEIDRSSSNGHPNWSIFAESCLRAVLKSSPLRMPPAKPYAAWKTMKLRFSARDLLGL